MRLTALLIILATPLAAQDCGAPLPDFKAGLLAEATAMGIAAQTADAFLSGAQIDPAVLRADQAQGVFQLDFVTFSRRLISASRLDAGEAMGARYTG